MQTMTAPLTEETAYLLTDAGLDALRAAETPDTPETAAPEGFCPRTEAEVDWVLRKIADARARAERIRVNLEKMAAEADSEAKFFEWKYGAALMDFCRRQTEGRRKKSCRLPNGVLGFRTKPAAVQIADEAAALEWARENAPEAVAVRLDKAALSRALLETGEAVEFAALVPAEETFYIK